MSVTIEMGRLGKDEDGTVTAIWDGEAMSDGCDPFRAYANWPRRELGDFAFCRWMERDAMVRNLFCHTSGWAEGDAQNVRKLDAGLVSFIGNIPPLEGHDGDRLRWLQFWARAARDRYGDAAVLLVR